MPLFARQPCYECSPTHQLNHRAEWFSSITSETTERIVHTFIPRSVDQWSQRLIIGSLLRGMRLSRLLSERPLTHDMHVHQRTHVVADEAKKRGMTVNALVLFGRPTNLFTLDTGTTTHLFEGLPGVDPIQPTTTNIDDKEEARALFRTLGVPTPEGKSFHSEKTAVRYALGHGFHLIVKPRHGSLSAHTTVNIRDEKKLRAAIRCAQQVSRSFIVEEFIPGSLYRATTVGPRLVACGHREPPIITGDGVRTVQTLFDERDAERKTLLLALGYTLATIPPLSQSQMQLDPKAILPKGQSEPLTWKVNIAFGAGVKDVTDEVHPDNRELFERIASAVDLPTLGIDFIAPSIAVSWKDQKCACIELNSLPSIDLHHPPIVQGEFRNVAGALLDYVLESDVYYKKH